MVEELAGRNLLRRARYCSLSRRSQWRTENAAASGDLLYISDSYKQKVLALQLTTLFHSGTIQREATLFKRLAPPELTA